MDQLPVALIVNPETAEITQEIYEGDRLTLTRKSQTEYFKSHINDFNKDKSFVKIYDDVVPLLEKYLTLPEFKFAICLTPHVSYEDCIIRENQNRSSRILGIKDLAEIHGYKYGYARKIMSLLRHKGVIGRHETGTILEDYSGTTNVVFTVNPFIYFRGTDMLSSTYSFYMNSGWKELLSETEN